MFLDRSWPIRGGAADICMHVLESPYVSVVKRKCTSFYQL